MAEYYNQKKNKGNVPVGLIVGFSILFTPLFFIGIIVIVITLVSMMKKKQGISFKAGQNMDTITSYLEQPEKVVMYKNVEAPKRHIRDHEPKEKMTKEDRENYKRYHSVKNSYEQTVVPVRVKKNETNICQVCRNTRTKNTPYCQVCGELFGEGLKCTFCKTKNELNTQYCKNCGVKFKK